MTEEEQVAHEKKQKLQRQEELDDLRKLLATPEGMRFFKRFLDAGSMFKSTFTGNSTGMFLEGQRALALKFFSDLCEAAPEKISDLLIRGESKS